MTSLPSEAPSSPVIRQTGEPRWLTPLLLLMVAVAFVVSPWPLEAKLRAISAAVSTNIASHMLVVGPDTLPMNARTTGIFLGVVVCVSLLLITGRGRANRFPPRSVLALLSGLFAAMILDGFNSLLFTLQATHPGYHSWYQPTNDLRVITGVFSGLAMAMIGGSIVNALLWRHEHEPMVEDTVELSGYLIVCVLVILIVLRRLPALYWPLALISVGGFLLLATMVNLVAVIVAFRRERRARTWRDALPLILGALLLSIGEIAFIDTISGRA